MGPICPHSAKVSWGVGRRGHDPQHLPKEKGFLSPTPQLILQKGRQLGLQGRGVRCGLGWGGGQAPLGSMGSYFLLQGDKGEGQSARPQREALSKNPQGLGQEVSPDPVILNMAKGAKARDQGPTPGLLRGCCFFGPEAGAGAQGKR